jgi:tetratricopeptide (TPR) repeat protein
VGRIAEAEELAAKIAARTGRPGEAVEHATRAIAASRGRSLPVAYQTRGASYHLLGRLAEARADFECALVLYRELGDTLGTVLTTANLAVVDGDAGQPMAALERTRAAAETFRRLGLARREAHWRSNLGNLYLDLGLPDEAEIELVRGQLARAKVALEAALAALGSAPLARVEVHARLAELALAEGQPDRAREHVSSAEQGMGDAGVVGPSSWSRRLLGLRARLG